MTSMIRNMCVGSLALAAGGHGFNGGGFNGVRHSARTRPLPFKPVDSAGPRVAQHRQADLRVAATSNDQSFPGCSVEDVLEVMDEIAFSGGQYIDEGVVQSVGGEKDPVQPVFRLALDYVNVMMLDDAEVRVRELEKNPLSRNIKKGFDEIFGAEVLERAAISTAVKRHVDSVEGSDQDKAAYLASLEALLSLPLDRAAFDQVSSSAFSKECLHVVAVLYVMCQDMEAKAVSAKDLKHLIVSLQETRSKLGDEQVIRDIDAFPWKLMEESKADDARSYMENLAHAPLDDKSMVKDGDFSNGLRWAAFQFVLRDMLNAGH